MQCGNGASGAVAVLAIGGHDQGRTAGPLDDPGSDDANHSSMPAFAIKDQAERIRKFRSSSQSLLDFGYNSRFFILPFSIEGIQFCGDLTASMRILAGKQLDYIACYVHSSRCVNPRPE